MFVVGEPWLSEYVFSEKDFLEHWVEDLVEEYGFEPGEEKVLHCDDCGAKLEGYSYSDDIAQYCYPCALNLAEEMRSKAQEKAERECKVYRLPESLLEEDPEDQFRIGRHEYSNYDSLLPYGYERGPLWGRILYMAIREQIAQLLFTALEEMAGEVANRAMATPDTEEGSAFE